MSEIQQAMALLIGTFNRYSGKEGDPFTLSNGELNDLLREQFGDLLGKSKDQAAVDKIFKALDDNKDNSVDFNEYMHLVCSLTMLCHEFFRKNK